MTDLIEQIAVDQMQRGLSDAASERELRAALVRQGVSTHDADLAVLDVCFARQRLAHEAKVRRLQADYDAALAAIGA